MAIEEYFIQFFYESYSPDEIPHYVKTVYEAFKLQSHCTVKSIIKAVKTALDNDEEYNATCKTYTIPLQWKIQQGGFEEHLVSMYKEHGASYYNTMKSFNGVHQTK